MHGVRRNSEPIPKEVIKQQEEDEQPQITYYKGLISKVIQLRNEASTDVDIAGCMSSTAEILLLNPDFLTAWRLRRKVLSLLMRTADMEAIKQELEFSVETIKVNPKSYGSWHHRQWLIGKALSKQQVNIPHELKLCSKLLDLDSRNFHCWNYRWFLFCNFGESTVVDIKEEFDFTTLMIYKNFSNYSAWHRRSLFFPLLAPLLEEEGGLRKAIMDDLKLVKSAYFTEPADQSCWFYLCWLLAFAVDEAGFDREQLFRSELDNISELLSIEPDAPLALFTWCQIAETLNGAISSDLISSALINERLAILRTVDPLRSEMYNSMQHQ